MPGYSFRALTAITGVMIAVTSCAQPAGTDFSRTEMEEVVRSVGTLLTENYVYPEKARKMADMLHRHLDSGRYDSIRSQSRLAAILTGDLMAICQDKHLRVIFTAREGSGAGRASAPENSPDQAGRNTFGFLEVKVLEGNIGYLDLRGFHDVRYAEDVAVESMNKLMATDALIIDLRRNGGGSPTMIQLISSYLFSDQPVHLNTFYWRPADEYTETWTLEEIPGTRRPDLEVFILTSSYTFSAAEEFSYNLKHMKRATLIGETTGGGAHPGGPLPASHGFTVWVPQGRAINPVTGTNWEGKGVEPHIAVNAEEAHLAACQKALQKLAENSASDQRVYYTDLLKKLSDNPVLFFKE